MVNCTTVHFMNLMVLTTTSDEIRKLETCKDARMPVSRSWWVFQVVRAMPVIHVIGLAVGRHVTAIRLAGGGAARSLRHGRASGRGVQVCHELQVSR